MHRDDLLTSCDNRYPLKPSYKNVLVVQYPRLHSFLTSLSSCPSFLSLFYPRSPIMRLASALAAVTALFLSLSDCSRLTPPVLPLIVRNPYLSTWLPNARDQPWEKWPIHWTGQEIGLSILASMPDTRTAYPLLGRPHDSLRHSGEDGLRNWPAPKICADHAQVYRLISPLQGRKLRCFHHQPKLFYTLS